jgi:hypothetical protein
MSQISVCDDGRQTETSRLILPSLLLRRERPAALLQLNTIPANCILEPADALSPLDTPLATSDDLLLVRPA